MLMHNVPAAKEQTPRTNPQDQNQQQTNNVKPPLGYNPYGNIPIEKDTTSGYNDSVVKKSLRPDDAFDKELHQ